MDAPADTPHPFAELIGMETVVESPGTARASVDIGPQHANPHGVTHGAVVFALVDTSMGGAAASMLGLDSWPASIEVQVRFLRPVLGGRLEARTEVVRPGSRVMHLESRVHDADGRLVATGAGSFAVLDARPGG
jgi:uncharacterized protein (TIGR00369 family)